MLPFGTDGGNLARVYKSSHVADGKLTLSQPRVSKRGVEKELETQTRVTSTSPKLLKRLVPLAGLNPQH